ncbi:unnamed protein product [Camellia sinensis]
MSRGAGSYFWKDWPVKGGIWATVTDSAFGAYTPCGIDSVVVCISHLVLLGLCFYRTRGTNSDQNTTITCWVSWLVIVLLSLCLDWLWAFHCLIWKDRQVLLPSRMVSLIIVALAWCSMLVILGIETGIYIREFRWYVRFGAAYGGCSMLNLILHRICAAYVPHHTFHSVQVLFGVFLFVYIPQLDPYPGYVPIRNDPLIDTKYEALLGGEHVCPERDASIFSRICFGFHICWAEESQRPKPWLLRALNNSLGGRF